MMEIMLAVLIGITVLCGIFYYNKCREEAKRDGFVSDDYIENNEEEEDDE